MKSKKELYIILGVIVLVIIWVVLISPLFISKKVIEEIPEDFSFLTDPDTGEFVMPEQDDIDRMTPEVRNAIEQEVVQMFEDKPDSVVNQGESTVRSNLSMTEEEGQPRVLQTGTFVGADSFHQGSGFARILQSAAGSQIVRLDSFSVTNGPDLHVLLSTSENPTDDLGEYVDLGGLKGNVGGQNYIVPAGTDTSIYKSIVIYCKPFSVVFSSAKLTQNS